MKSHAEKSNSEWTKESKTEDAEDVEEASVVHVKNLEGDDDDKMKVIPIERDREVYEVIDSNAHDVNDNIKGSSAHLIPVVSRILYVCAIHLILATM